MKRSEVRVLSATSILFAALAAGTGPACSDVVRFDVSSREAAFGGRDFAPSGTAEKIVGHATIAVDPRSPADAGIVDLDKAPRDAAGKVEATADVTILRPARPNGTMIVELPNRGRRLILNLVEEVGAAQAANIAAAGDAGRGFLLSRGYTVVWVGWQGDVTPQQGLGLRVPTVPGVEGPSRDEWILPDGAEPVRKTLAYPIADPASLRLTVRDRPEAERETPEGLSVRRIDDTTVEISRPKKSFGKFGVYELTYTARDPKVMGLAFAALRDVATFLRNDTSAANPLAEGGRTTVTRAIGFGISQSGRVLRDFLYRGFNDDGHGRRVFEAMMAEIPGARRSFTNARFAQPGRNPGPGEDRGYPLDQFPFSYATSTDPATGRSDGLMERCRKSDTCPKIMQIDSEFELWASHGSLLMTDPVGHHLDLPDDVRAYMISGAPHFIDATTVSGPNPNCRMPTSPVFAGPVVRALIVALDRWAGENATPPTSRYPTRASGTLAAADGLYPAIPGLAYEGRHVPADRIALDGAVPKIVGEYPLYLPRGDGDGNALGGVRLPIVAAARATYTGWNVRSDGKEICTQIGTALPFARTKAERIAAGDPRRSIEERYGDEEGYVAAVKQAADDLVVDRLLLPEDAAAMVAEARQGTLARLPK